MENRSAKMRASRFIVRGLCLKDRALRTEREVRSVQETYEEMNDELRQENDTLRRENDTMRPENAALRNDIEQLHELLEYEGNLLKQFDSTIHGCLQVMWKKCQDGEDALEKYTKDVLAGLKATEQWHKEDGHQYNDRWVGHEQTIVNCVKRLYQSEVLKPNWYSVHHFIHMLITPPSWNAEHLLYMMRTVSEHAKDTWAVWSDLPDPKPSHEVFQNHVHETVMTDFFNQYATDVEITHSKEKWSTFGLELIICLCGNFWKKRKRWNVHSKSFEYV